MKIEQIGRDWRAGLSKMAPDGADREQKHKAELNALQHRMQEEAPKVKEHFTSPESLAASLRSAASARLAKRKSGNHNCPLFYCLYCESDPQN
jgi:hypothetical protein